MALTVTDANYKEVLNAGKPVVLDFWAEWCGPCRMVSPIIDELATEYEGRVTIGKINVDENDEVVSEYGIRNIPTILRYIKFYFLSSIGAQSNFHEIGCPKV